jgi:SIR2-like protein
MKRNQSLSHLKSLVRKDSVVPVLGTGFSTLTSGGISCASWGGLLRDAIQYLKASHNIDNTLCARLGTSIDNGTAQEMTHAAGEIVELFGGPSTEAFKAWLTHSVGKLSPKRRDLFPPLEKLGPIYLTTNYDGLIEHGLGGPALTWRDREKVQQVIRGDNYGVIHVHGYWEDPESLVLGPTSYEAVANDPFTQAMLRHLVFGKSLLFIGFGAGLHDRNFTQLRDWMRPWTEHSCYAHFRLVRHSELEAITNDHASDPRIVPIPYGEAFDDLPTFLQMITEELPKPLTRPSRPVRWRMLEDLKFPLLSLSSAQFDFFLRELGFCAMHTFGISSKTEFAILYRLRIMDRLGMQVPTFELLCHKADFLINLRDRMNRFFGGLEEIRQHGGLRAEKERFVEAFRAPDVKLGRDWKTAFDFVPVEEFRTVTLTLDPDNRKYSLRTDANDSLSLSDYSTQCKTTSDALRFLAACLNQEYAVMNLDPLLENPKCIDMLVDVLDKVGIDLNAFRINADDDEEWTYVNVPFKKETGEFYSPEDED